LKGWSFVRLCNAAVLLVALGLPKAYAEVSATGVPRVMQNTTLSVEQPGVVRQMSVQLSQPEVTGETLISTKTYDEFSAAGVLRATQKATLSVEQPGVVRQMSVQLGQPVVTGEVLLRLDCRLFEGEYQQARAERRAVDVRLKGDRQLLSLKSIGRETVLLTEIDRDRAIATENIAKLAVDRCSVRAPFDGVVSQISVRAFDAVEVNQAVLEVVSLDRTQVEFVVPAAFKLSSGLRVWVTSLDAQRAPASVTAWSPVVDPASQTRVVRAILDELPRGWSPGLAVKVKLRHE